MDQARKAVASILSRSRRTSGSGFPDRSGSLAVTVGLNATVLLGLAGGGVAASRAVADESAFTVIVARQVDLYEGQNLDLEANYDPTSVPVPKGVGPLSGKLQPSP